MKKLSLTSIVFVCLILIGCPVQEEIGKPDIGTVPPSESSVSGDSISFKVSLKSSSSLGYKISKVSASLVKGDTKIEQDFSIVNDFASGSFNGLSPGIYILSIEAFDDEELVATAQSNVNIESGKLTSKDIVLKYVTGSVSVDVTWDDGGNSTGGSVGISSLDFVGVPYSKSDYIENIRVFGEVKNSSETDFSFVKISCDFFDINNSKIGSDYTYIYGSCGKLSLTTNTTNTVIFSGETGAWEMYTNIEAKGVSNFNCRISSNAYKLEPRLSNLKVMDITESRDSIDFLVLDGTVVNNGSVPLVFGQVYATTKNNSNKVIGISSTYINGENTYLPSIKDYTDTGLLVNSTGTFSLQTVNDFDNVSSYKISTCADDVDVNSTIKKPSFKYMKPKFLINEKIFTGRQRDKIIDDVLYDLEN